MDSPGLAQQGEPSAIVEKIITIAQVEPGG